MRWTPLRDLIGEMHNVNGHLSSVACRMLLSGYIDTQRYFNLGNLYPESVHTYLH